MKVSQVEKFVKEGRYSFRSLLDKRDTSLGFNAFELVSDIYRRENFHSDVMCAIINPRSKHGEGLRFLQLFITYLSQVARLKMNDELSRALIGLQFKCDCVSVERERDKIDLLIEGSDWAIIIENKINGADDMYRQLPRYVEKTTARGKRVVAIVYITAAVPKEPRDDEWNDKDKEIVLPILLSVVGYNETSKDLDIVKGWLERCELEASQFSTRAVLSQYCELLRNQAGETMNQEEMIKLFGVLKENKIGYNELLKVLYAMPHALSKKIVQDCSGITGVRKVWIYKTAVAVFELNAQLSKMKFAIDVHCENLSDYGVSFFERTGEADISSYVEKVNQFDSRFIYDEKWGRLVLKLDADQVFVDVDNFILFLKNLINHILRIIS